jgi:bifunctional DNA-binding transcriptional regulator/antitoxin component of YhaV-PrlF toxin-antitoxin module
MQLLGYNFIMQIFKTIRTTGGYSLMVIIPAEIKQTFELNAGDEVSMEIEEDGVKMKFYESKKNQKVEALKAALKEARMQEEQVVEAP